MATAENALLLEEYDCSHISIAEKEKGTAKNGEWAQYECMLEGEKVGHIDYRAGGFYSNKHYCAYVQKADEDGDKWFGEFSSLYEAKQALLKPAREYLDFLRRVQESAPVKFLPETDYEFYPTPSDVAGKLLAGVKWRNVVSILEPSAGKGDLIGSVMSMMRIPYKQSTGRWDWNNKRIDIDCIEIDPNLRSILKGHGLRVVHDDFLTFHSRKYYDLILMNPPFSDGELHLLHAIELIEGGGQVACILNAETIRNPYTVSRKALLKELHRLGASIQYYQDAFTKAQRKASVDIAIINILVEPKIHDTSIWDDMKKAADYALEQSCGNMEIAPSNNVERLIRECDLMCAAGIELMRKYNGVSPHIHSGKGEWSSPLIQLNVCGDKVSEIAGSDCINRYLRSVRARYWRELFDLPDIRNQMTTDMKNEYESTIEQMRDYEFSEFNIRQVLQKIMGQIKNGVEEAIIKCFDKLSAEHAYHTDLQNENVHYYSGWKTNKAHYVNTRCIIPTWGCFAREYKPDKYGRYHDVLDGLNVNGCFGVLDDLEKALDYLDNGETGKTDLCTQLELAAKQGRTSGIECKYFTVKFYKKGTCHIQFRDSKIVDRLNIYVGRKRTWLPPSYGKKQYMEMDEEERKVVDSFQGQEKYDRIMENTGDYLIEPAQNGVLLLG